MEGKRKCVKIEELRKRKVNVCCIQKVRWKGQGARFVGTLGQRYKLWWSGMMQDSEGLEFW